MGHTHRVKARLALLGLSAALFWGLNSPVWAGICVDSAFANCAVQTTPIIIDTFFGNQTTADGKQSLAFQAWEQDIGEPTRVITFDDAPLPGPTLLLADFTGSDRGLVTTALGDSFAFKTGGDIGLFPLFRDPDNLLIKEQNTAFKGVRNVTDLTQPNLNLLGPDGNGFIEINFGEGIDLGTRSIRNFGAVEAVAAFLSTTDPVTLSISDADGLPIFEFTRTPPDFNPFLMGVVLPRRDQPKQEIIATARFTFTGPTSTSALDGLVFTTVVDAAPPAAPVPEPGTLLLLGSGLVGLGAKTWRRSRRKES